MGCEACHGPGSDHVSAPTTANIDRVYEFDINDGNGLILADGSSDHVDPNGDRVNNLCGTCHNRGFNAPIEAKSGYIKHHEVWEESLTWDGHAGMSCSTCHDPHKRVIWGGEGIKMDCTTCHTNHEANTNHAASASCTDCHMPYAGKSAVARGESGYKGDIHSHLFKITVNEESMFTEDGTLVRDDETRSASLDLGFACLGCHNDAADDAIPDKTLAEAVASAANMHGTNSTDPNNTVPAEFHLAQNYPNPFNPTTTIDFSLKKESEVRVVVYDLIGKQIATLANSTMGAGNYQLRWNGTTDNGRSVPAGVYFTEMRTPEYHKTIKMVYLK